MIRGLRVVVVLVVVVAAVAACSSSSTRKRKGKRHTTTTVSRTHRTPAPGYSTRTYTPTPTPTTTPGTGTACRAGDVAVRISRPAKESADLVVSSGGRTCTLSGYPDVALRDAAYDVPTTVKRQPGSTRSVRLSSGRSATSRLSWTSTEPNGENCTAHPTGLRVTFPGGSSTTALWPASNEPSICDDTITVSPFR